MQRGGLHFKAYFAVRSLRLAIPMFNIGQGDADLSQNFQDFLSVGVLLAQNIIEIA